MGMSTCYSIPVKAKIIAWFQGTKGLPDWLRAASCEKEQYGEYLWDQSPNANTPPAVPDPFTLGQGWVQTWQLKTIKDLYVCVLKKGDKEVYGLNTDQYSCVGEITVEFFADDEDVLIEFISDLMPGRETEIERDTTIHQWM